MVSILFVRCYGIILDSSCFCADILAYFHRYKKWLPDNVVGRHDTKFTYQVEIRYANNTNETFTFHGPQGVLLIFHLTHGRLILWVS